MGPPFPVTGVGAGCAGNKDDTTVSVPTSSRIQNIHSCHGVENLERRGWSDARPERVCVSWCLDHRMKRCASVTCINQTPFERMRHLRRLVVRLKKGYLRMGTAVSGFARIFFGRNGHVFLQCSFLHFRQSIRIWKRLPLFCYNRALTRFIQTRRRYVAGDPYRSYAPCIFSRFLDILFQREHHTFWRKDTMQAFFQLLHTALSDRDERAPLPLASSMTPAA